VRANHSEALRDEIFGPSVAIYAARDEAQAIALANDTSFGLALSIFTADKALMARLRAGQRDAKQRKGRLIG
jgi:acyl-CoA reductase-like NAD-dependent aldehyde dehydrogenase